MPERFNPGTLTAALAKLSNQAMNPDTRQTMGISHAEEVTAL